jgi:hypothetical protein
MAREARAWCCVSIHMAFLINLCLSVACSWVAESLKSLEVGGTGRRMPEGYVRLLGEAAPPGSLPAAAEAAEAPTDAAAAR